MKILQNLREFWGKFERIFEIKIKLFNKNFIIYNLLKITNFEKNVNFEIRHLIKGSELNKK